jgi:hypothetical protein
MRGLTYMPLHIERLQKSKAWLVCKRRPELAFYILNLWMRAWTEEPAGSIENDDDVMSDAAMCPPDKWPKLKEDALRGWVLCSDGRWYHPTVCEIALETWEEQTIERARRALDRERKRTQADQDIRAAVLAKTGGLCWHCQVRVTTDDHRAPTHFHVDHFIPLSKGGANEIGNLVPSCKRCNLVKGDRLIGGAV